MSRHSHLLLQHLHHLYQHHLLTDVVLVVENQSYYAHAALLVAYSKYFQSVLQDRAYPQVNELILNNTSAASVEALLDFLYTGKLPLDASNVVDMYMVSCLAKQLQIETLENACQKVISDTESSQEFQAPTDIPVLVKTEHPEDRGDADGLPDDCVSGEPLTSGDAEDQESAEEKPSSSKKSNGDLKVKEEDITESDGTQDASDEEWLPPAKDKDQVSMQKERKHNNMSAEVSALGSTRRSLRKSGKGAAMPETEVETPARCARKRRCVEPSTDPEAVGPKRRPGRPPKGAGGHIGAGSYKCPRCGKRFDKKANLAIHIDMHDREVEKNSRFHCRHCQGAFRSRTDLEKHLPKHGLSRQEVELELVVVFDPDPDRVPVRQAKVSLKGELVWICHECCEEFDRADRLAGHMKSAHPDVRLHCCKCDYVTQVDFYLDRHMKTHGSDTKPITCEICHKTFTRQLRLRRHKHKKHGIADPDLEGKLLSCPQEGCRFTGWTDFIIKKHVRDIHTAKESGETHICDNCGQTFRHRVSLQGHIARKHSTLKFMCDQCGMSLPTSAELKRHLAKHNPVKEFQCEHCPYSTSNSLNLRGHLFRKHGIKPSEAMTPYRCEECPYENVCRNALSKHVASCHPAESEKKVCSECGKVFKTKAHLRQHISVVHSQKLLSCHFCAYKAVNMTKLAEHMRIQHTHRDYKPFQCPYCDYVCATSNNCLKHVKNRHKGKKATYIKVGVIPPASVQLRLQQNKTLGLPPVAASGAYWNCTL